MYYQPIINNPDRKVIERIEEGLEVENVVDTEITAVCVRVKILEDRNQVAVVNSFEAFNSREIEPRNIYQVNLRFFKSWITGKFK